VSVILGEQPVGETVPKHQDISNEDFAGGVPKGAKVTLQEEDNFKISGANPKIRSSPPCSKASTEKQAIAPLELSK